MKTISKKQVKMDDVWVFSIIIMYSNNKIVNRIYAVNGQLIDAIPIKDISNQIV